MQAKICLIRDISAQARVVPELKRFRKTEPVDTTNIEVMQQISCLQIHTLRPTSWKNRPFLHQDTLHNKYVRHIVIFSGIFSHGDFIMRGSCLFSLPRLILPALLKRIIPSLSYWKLVMRYAVAWISDAIPLGMLLVPRWIGLYFLLDSCILSQKQCPSSSQNY